jgi:hypothetical protein
MYGREMPTSRVKAAIDAMTGQRQRVRQHNRPSTQVSVIVAIACPLGKL